MKMTSITHRAAGSSSAELFIENVKSDHYTPDSANHVNPASIIFVGETVVAQYLNHKHHIATDAASQVAADPHIVNDG
ncbi:MAG: hypothetical protein AAF823_02420 [Planctomycetota bacterium]